MDDHFMGFTPLHDDGEATLDIIAVTGLAGHALGSFRSKQSSEVWLRDRVPEVVPQARIMTCAYDRGLVGSDTKASIRDYAMYFLDETIRVRKLDPYRPLIFIAHSLGGLVVKEALSIASDTQRDRGRETQDASHDSENVLASTAGLVFFGVPNLGLRHGQLCTAVDGCPNASLVEILQVDRDSEPKELLSELDRRFKACFRQQSPAFQVLAYYEREESPVIENVNGKWARIDRKQLIVTRQSACHIGVGENKHNEHPLYINHSDLVKFSHFTDQDYERVVNHMERLVAAAFRTASRRLGNKASPEPDHHSTNPSLASDTASSSSLPIRAGSTEITSREHKQGITLYREGKYAEAEAMFRKAMLVKGQTLGNDYRSSLESKYWLGSVLGLQKKYDESKRTLLDVVEKQHRALGKDDVDTLSSKAELGSVCYKQGRYAEAEKVLAEAAEEFKRTQLSDHERALRCNYYLGCALRRRRRYAEAETVLSKVMKRCQRSLGNDHEHTLNSQHQLGWVLYEQNRYVGSEVIARQAYQGKKKILGKDHKYTLDSQHLFGRVLYMQGQYAEAELMALEAVRGRKKIQDVNTQESMDLLKDIVREQGKCNEAKPLHRRIRKGRIFSNFS